VFAVPDEGPIRSVYMTCFHINKYNMKIRNRLHKNATRSKRPEELALFKQPRNTVVNLFGNAKRNFSNSVVDKVNEQNPTDKAWWRLVGSVMSRGHQKSKHIPSKEYSCINPMNDFFRFRFQM
jgi:capsule polysaccharide export protein KpsC/LpsZ